MKRKSPSSQPKSSKRRRIEGNTTTPYTPRDGVDQDETDVDSPMITTSNTGISPRPATIMTETLRNKQMMAERKSITLTDDSSNIIMEEDEEVEDPFADENEVEIARGSTRNRNRRSSNRSKENVIHYDPFSIPEDDPIPTVEIERNEPDSQRDDDTFQTIPEETLDSENDIETEHDSPRRVAVAKSKSQRFPAQKRVAVAMSHITTTDKRVAIAKSKGNLSGNHESDNTELTDLEALHQIGGEELVISQLTRNRDIGISGMSDVTDGDNRSMNMSLQLEMEKNMNLIPRRKTHDTDSVISDVFRDIDISRIESVSQHSTQSIVADDELSDDADDGNDENTKMVSSKSNQSTQSPSAPVVTTVTAVSPPRSIHIAPEQEGNLEDEQQPEYDQHIESAINPIIERSENLEEDEKAMELDDEDVVLPTIQRQQRIFSQTVAEENENETVIQIHDTAVIDREDTRSEDSEILDLSTIQKPKKVKKAVTYSARKDRGKRKTTITTPFRSPDSPQRVRRNQDLLTPISRELVHRLNRSILAPSTRSRRQMNERPNTGVGMQLTQDLQFEPSVIEQEQRRQQLMERKRREQREQSQSQRGRSFSLMDHFRENAPNLGLENGDNVVDEEIMDDSEEERRLMVLNQSGFNEEANAIERERERTRKRRRTRKKLADHAKRKRAAKRKGKDKEKYANIQRPKMTNAVRQKYQEMESKMAAFWRELERKMENNEYAEDIKVIENEGDIRIKGRRSLTPPRIKKHLERRYTKQYENMTGEVVQDYGRKKKGKRVWFLNQRVIVMDEKQERVWNDERNNSLITVTPESSVSPVMIEMERTEIGMNAVDDHGDNVDGLGIQQETNITMEDLIVPDDSRISTDSRISGLRDLSEIGTIDDDNDSVLAVVQEDVSGDSGDPFKNSRIMVARSMMGSGDREKKSDTQEKDDSSTFGGYLPSIAEDDAELMDDSSSFGGIQEDGDEAQRKKERSIRRRQDLMDDMESVGTTEALNDPFAA